MLKAFNFFWRRKPESNRRINDNMGKYTTQKTIKMLIYDYKQVRNARIAILGVSFKENIPDIRNTTPA